MDKELRADLLDWAKNYLVERRVPEKYCENLLEAALHLIPGEGRTILIVGPWMWEAAQSMMTPQEIQDGEISSHSDRWLIEAIYRKMFPV